MRKDVLSVLKERCHILIATSRLLLGDFSSLGEITTPKVGALPYCSPPWLQLPKLGDVTPSFHLSLWQSGTQQVAWTAGES